jgi:hypothetical protein
MYLEELVEVALGLILVFVVVSLAVMQIQEWLAGWLRWRAIHLEDAIRSMLNEPVQRTKVAAWLARYGIGWKRERSRVKGLPAFVEQLYEHPLIRSLAQPGNLPSYIPADKFALALFDTIMSAGTNASTIQKALVQLRENQVLLLDQAVRQALDLLIEQARQAVNDQAALARLKVALEEFKEQYPQLRAVVNVLLQAELPKDSEKILAQLRDGAATLIVANPELKQAIDSLITQAETYAKKGEDVLALTRANVEKWFDDTMDRAGGWYKRNAQGVSLVISLVLVLIFNVDAIHISTRLWREPTLRQFVVAQAERYSPPESAGSAEVGQTIDALQGELQSLQIPVGWTFAEVPFDRSSQRCTLFPAQATEDVLGMPWNGTCKVWVDPPRGWGIAIKIIGLTVSALATMQGAPFWFDILKKIINIRSSGAKPGETEADRS